MDAQPRQQRIRKVREERKPACDTCRAQKLRCDASLDYSRPCTRCRRKQLPCIVEEHRRKKTSSKNSPNAPLPVHVTGTVGQASQHSSSPALALSDTANSLRAHSASVGENSGPLVAAADHNVLQTESRVIDGICIEANKIDICFSRFFRYFAPLIPILSEQSTPNRTFGESILKFWVIITIGSRQCLEDPTLFSTLSPRVEALALQSLYLRRHSAYPIIEAFLLMCSFHLSTNEPSWRSIYLTLSSAVVPIALQAGMHQCSGIKGLSSTMAAPQAERGTKLWTYAILINQITMALQGYVINNPSALRHVLWELDCCASLPRSLVYECRIMGHLASFHQLVEDLEHSSGLGDYSRSLRNRITASDADLLAMQMKVRLEDEGPLSGLYLVMCRLQIWCSVFTISTQLEHTDIVQLAEIAVALIDKVCDLGKRFSISLACPDSIFQGIQLAACTLMKLLKTYPSKTGLLEKNMTNALFSAINTVKSISVMNNDVPAKVAQILGQLWSHPKVYQSADGNYVFSLQIRNRLSMNVVFDCLHWWRKLFLGPPEQDPQDTHAGNSELLHPSHVAAGFADSIHIQYDDWGIWGLDWDSSGALEIPGGISLDNDV